MRNWSRGIFWLAVMMTALPAAAGERYEVGDFGATGNGVTLDTQAINDAIAAAAQAGGGTVYFDAGTYLSGSIHLRSHVHLELGEAAVLKAAPNEMGVYDPPEPNPWNDYQDFGHSHFHNALMWGEGLEDVAIHGRGAIDGDGMSTSDPAVGGGDKAIALKRCRNIRIHDLAIHRGGHFAILMNGCEDVLIRNLTMRTGRDGINVISSRNVVIEGCDIEAFRWPNLRKGGGDDAIALKSDYALGEKLPVEHVRIRNCRLSGSCNGIQFGSETVGDFRDIEVRDCVIVNADKAGIGITTNDGGVIEDVRMRNIMILKAANPIFMNVTDRLRTPEDATAGTIRNVTLEDITAVDSHGHVKRHRFTSTISGMPDRPLENITLRNARIVGKGGGTPDMAEIVPPYPEGYQPRKLGRRPAYGLYARHVRNLLLDGATFAFEQPDGRPALVFDKSQGIRLHDVKAARSEGADVDVLTRQIDGIEIDRAPGLRLKNVD